MDQLWAPWRMTYIKSATRNRRCFFCDYLRQKNDRRHLILKRTETCMAIVNKYPYNAGHVMVAPQAHKGKFHELTKEERLDLFGLTVDMQRALDKVLTPHGYNLGINLGRVAGAGILSHIHMHIVPRWNGDTNFMPTIGQTKVIPLALDSLYAKLLDALNKRRGAGR